MRLVVLSLSLIAGFLGCSAVPVYTGSNLEAAEHSGANAVINNPEELFEEEGWTRESADRFQVPESKDDHNELEAVSYTPVAKGDVDDSKLKDSRDEMNDGSSRHSNNMFKVERRGYYDYPRGRPMRKSRGRHHDSDYYNGRKGDRYDDYYDDDETDGYEFNEYEFDENERDENEGGGEY